MAAVLFSEYSKAINIVVRAATSHDISRIREMIREMFTEVSAYGHRDSSAVVISMVEDAIHAGQKVFVSDNGDNIVGVCAWVQLPDANGEVLGLGTFVESESRRFGISSGLRSAAVDYWKERGATHIAGTVDVGNMAGLASATEQGFELTGFIVEKQLDA
jgi:GNAT superfamily N-acetyltransferase